MTHIRKTIIPFFIVLAFFPACTDVEPYGEQMANSFQISVSPSSVTLDDYGQASVYVTATNNMYWSCDNLRDFSNYLDLSDNSGVGSTTIAIQAANDNDSKRDQRKTVQLTSDRYSRRASFDVVIPGTYLQCSPESPHFTADGGSITLTVKSNADWSIYCPSWMSSARPSTGGRGVTNVTLKAPSIGSIYSYNDSISFQTAAGSFSYEVSQDGEEVRLSLDPKDLYLPYTASSGNRVNVNSNAGSWVYSIDSPTYDQDASENWVSTDMWGTYFYVIAKANDHLYNRKATIIVTTVGKQATLTVNQAAAPERLSYSPEEDAVFTATGYRSGSTTYKYKDYTVSTNVSSWYVYSKPSWVDYDVRSNNVLRISVNSSNTSTSSDNKGDVVVKAGSKTATIHVKQLRKSSTDINLDDFGNDKSLD